LSSDRLSRRVLMLSLLGLAGCGFAPLHGDGGVARGAFSFEAEETVLGFRLSGRLAERLGAAQTPEYVIKTTITTSQRAAAITEEGDTSRLNIIGTATWTLLDIATGTQVAGGDVQGFTSYSATGSTVATQTAQDDAGDRLAVILADLIVTRVLVALS